MRRSSHTRLPPSETAALIRSRRTIHLFAPERPPEATILEALDLARWAPNHRHTEPWRFYLLGRETAAAIAHLNADLVTARRGREAGQAKLKRWLGIPGWLVLTCAASDDPVRAQEDYAACCCAAQNMQLYLWSNGIGMKWTTGPVTREPRFAPLIGMHPDDEVLVGLFWYGYPAVVPETQRKPLSSVLFRRP